MKKNEEIAQEAFEDSKTLVDQIVSNIKGDMIAEQQIEEWKTQYKKIYKTVVGDEIFFWHKLRRQDYIQIATDKSYDDIESVELRTFMKQEAFLKACVLWPEGQMLDDIIEENAGIAVNVADEIVIKSGFKVPVTTQV